MKTATTFTKIQRFTHFAGRGIILYYLILSHIIIYYLILSYIIVCYLKLSYIILYHLILSYNELLTKYSQYQGRLFQYKLLPELLSGPNNKAMKPNLCQKQQPSNLCRLCSWKRTGSLRWSSILGARSWALLKMPTHWILREAITQKTNTFLENITRHNPVAVFNQKHWSFFSYSQNMHHSPNFFLLQVPIWIGVPQWSQFLSDPSPIIVYPCH